MAKNSLDPRLSILPTVNHAVKQLGYSLRRSTIQSNTRSRESSRISLPFGLQHMFVGASVGTMTCRIMASCFHTHSFFLSSDGSRSSSAVLYNTYGASTSLYGIIGLTCGRGLTGMRNLPISLQVGKDSPCLNYIYVLSQQDQKTTLHLLHNKRIFCSMRVLLRFHRCLFSVQFYRAIHTCSKFYKKIDPQ